MTRSGAGVIRVGLSLRTKPQTRALRLMEPAFVQPAVRGLGRRSAPSLPRHPAIPPFGLAREWVSLLDISTLYGSDRPISEGR